MLKKVLLLMLGLGMGSATQAAQPATELRQAQPYWWKYQVVSSPKAILPSVSLGEQVDANSGLLSESGMINYCLAQVMLKSDLERRNLGFVEPFTLTSFANSSYSLKASYIDRAVPDEQHPFSCYYYKKQGKVEFWFNIAGLKK